MEGGEVESLGATVKEMVLSVRDGCSAIELVNVGYCGVIGVWAQWTASAACSVSV